VRFHYQPVPVNGPQPRHLIGQPLISYRPLVPIRIRGPVGFKDLEGLVDTGSEFTLFPMRWADIVGVGTGRQATLVRGYGGAQLTSHFAQVTLELRKRRKGTWAHHRWRAWVGFCADPQVLLGQDGFLQYFTATFACQAGTLQHPYQQSVTLQPNALFATVQAPSV
jgi:hypothetical protein